MERRIGLACMAASAPDGPPLVMSGQRERPRGKKESSAADDDEGPSVSRLLPLLLRYRCHRTGVLGKFYVTT